MAELPMHPTLVGAPGQQRGCALLPGGQSRIRFPSPHRLRIGSSNRRLSGANSSTSVCAKLEPRIVKSA
jgi:hypothetical protein